MGDYAKYCVKTVLLGLLGVPLMIGFGFLFAYFAVQAAGLGSLDRELEAWLIAVVVVVVTQVPLWRAWSRQRGTPETWLGALLPVAAAPALMLAGWSITYAIGGAWAVTSQPYGFLPHAVISGFAALTGLDWLVPVVLIAVLLVSVGSYAWGRTRREPPPRGKAGLAGVLVGALLLSAVPAWQAGYAVWLDGLPRVGDEVNLWDYRPWEPGNRLVTPEQPPSLQLTDDFPVLDGATALYPVYAAVGQAMYVRPEEPGDLKEGAEFVDFYLGCSRTSAAYDRLLADDADVIFVAQPSQGHLAKAEQAGIELTLTPIGREAFTFFVNAENPVTSLTSDQLRDIYSGTITGWEQVGGARQAITAYQRPEDSGSQTTMLAEVMRGTPMSPPLQDTVVSGMGGVIREVAGYRNLSSAIGYTFRWYATEMDADPGIRLLAVDGVEPTPESIRNGSYPFTVDIYAVTAESSNPNTARLVEWLRSSEGQALIEQVGYVGV